MSQSTNSDRVTLVVSESDAARVLAYLVTAARIQLDESPDYAAMRMITAATRLCESLQPESSTGLLALAARVRAVPPTATPSADPSGYRQLLDDLCVAVADYLLNAASVPS